MGVSLANADVHLIFLRGLCMMKELQVEESSCKVPSKEIKLTWTQVTNYAVIEDI